MSHSHNLDGVGNEFPAGQGIFHARMSHGNAVANPDGGEFHRRAAGYSYPRLHVLRNDIQVNMAGYDLIGGIYHADEGTGDLFVRVPHSLKQRTVGRPLNALFHCVTAHIASLLTYTYLYLLILTYFFLRSGRRERTAEPACHISLFLMTSSSFCSFSR